MKRIFTLALVLAGCNGPGAGGGSLVGTWELLGAPGSMPQGTLTLTSTRLNIMLGGDVFDLNTDGTPTFTWSDHGQSPTISATHSGGSFNAGAIPLALGGNWTFTGANGGSCNATMQAGSILGGCTNAGEGPLFDINRHATATRTQQMGSIFGDLGGVWTISDEYGNTCNVTLSGSTITGDCGGPNTSSRPGLTITFGDGVVSGTTASGAEFSARRQ